MKVGLDRVCSVGSDAWRTEAKSFSVLCHMRSFLEDLTGRSEMFAHRISFLPLDHNSCHVHSSC